MPLDNHILCPFFLLAVIILVIVNSPLETTVQEELQGEEVETVDTDPEISQGEEIETGEPGPEGPQGENNDPCEKEDPDPQNEPFKDSRKGVTP